MPTMMASAGRTSHENVNEISSETAIVTESPGIAPTYRPTRVPMPIHPIRLRLMKG